MRDDLRSLPDSWYPCFHVHVCILYMIPKAITAELIRNSPDVFRDLSLYLSEHRSRITGQPPADFPAGLKQLCAVVQLDTGINTSGLWGYLSDVTNDDGSISEIGEAIGVLAEIGATEIVSILDEALELWRDFLAVSRPDPTPGQKLSYDDFHRIRRLRESLDHQMDPLDNEYFHARSKLANVVANYVRNRPNEFIHPAHA